MHLNSQRSKEDIERYLQVLRCQSGDKKAFRTLFEGYNELSLRYLKGILDEQEAGDVNQEVWLNVYMKISGLSNPFGFKTWLYQIARNKAIDRLRRTKREFRLQQELKEEELSKHKEILFPIDNSFEELEKAIKKLSGVHREVIILRYWEEMSYEEMALVIGCSLGTVRSRLFYSTRYLKEILNNENTINKKAEEE